MAYADKITTMRRMALIRPKHNIEYEGVNIEGTCILKQVGYNSVMILKEDELEQFCFNEDLEVKYQDPEKEPYWEPRKSGFEE